MKIVRCQRNDTSGSFRESEMKRTSCNPAEPFFLRISEGSHASPESSSVAGPALPSDSCLLTSDSQFPGLA